MVFSSYSEIRAWRNLQIKKETLDHFKLNCLHDDLMHSVIELALKRINEELGSPPSSYCFFVMGSAGRFEQSIWSDQDHGIIFQENSPNAQEYFLRLGKEISDGLHQTGYAYCDGGVMASNPLWCKSMPEWMLQLANWIKESSWESIRHLLIFMDGRTLYGEHPFIQELKIDAYQLIHQDHLLARMLDNTMLLKKGVGLLGQFLTETHGPHTGLLNIKEKALYPYVNAVRLLAIKENIMETSTLGRLQKLSDKTLPPAARQLYENQFLKLLNYRLSLGDHTNYDSGHYLVVNKLTAEQKKEIKESIKNGPHLYHSIRKLVEKEV